MSHFRNNHTTVSLRAESLLFPLALLFVLLVALPSGAQRPWRHPHAGGVAAREAAIVRQYEDSLSRLSLRLDSVYAAADTLPAAPFVPSDRWYRLFTPLSLYRAPIHNRLSLDSVRQDDGARLLDDALLHVYLHHPEYVQATEGRLDEVGKTIVEEPGQMTVQPDLIGKVAPEPIESQPLPQDLVIYKPNFWSFSGDYYMQFMQNYVSSNWYKGGQSNYSMLGTLTLQANYNNQQKLKWENKLEMKLGFQTQKNDTVHHVKTSEDLVRYTGKLGLQAIRKWYYTFQLIGQTQFMRNFGSNNSYVYSDFMSPFSLNLSLGMDYSVNWLHNRLTGSVHLAPIACNYKSVGRKSLATRYGIDKGHSSKTDYGSEINVNLSWKISNNIRWKTRLYGYTTYERTEMEWENTFSFQVSRFLSSNLFFYPRFDDGSKRDDHHGYWQFKEYLSFGFSYSF